METFMPDDDLYAVATRFLLEDARSIGTAVQEAARESAASEIGELSELADDLAKRALGKGVPVSDNLRAARDCGVLPRHVFNDCVPCVAARTCARIVGLCVTRARLSRLRSLHAGEIERKMAGSGPAAGT
jgi:hypothetical protein